MTSQSVGAVRENSRSFVSVRLRHINVKIIFGLNLEMNFFRVDATALNTAEDNNRSCYWPVCMCSQNGNGSVIYLST
jgi:hypothetical protein